MRDLDDDLDADDWDDDPWEEDDSEPVVPCPYCGEEILEDAPRCPHCGQYVSAEDAPPPLKPWWIIAGVAVCLLLVYFWTIE